MKAETTIIAQTKIDVTDNDGLWATVCRTDEDGVTEQIHVKVGMAGYIYISRKENAVNMANAILELAGDWK